MVSSLADVASSQGLALLLGTVAVAAIAHLLVTRVFNTSFKRDAHNKTFSKVSGAAALLSNPDSVLSRENVEKSIAGYETLFAGARKKVGHVSTEDSIQHRAKEYKTLVNSFYDLVTGEYRFRHMICCDLSLGFSTLSPQSIIPDFYEWGWGQVS